MRMHIGKKIIQATRQNRKYRIGMLSSTAITVTTSVTESVSSNPKKMRTNRFPPELVYKIFDHVDTRSASTVVNHERRAGAKGTASNDDNNALLVAANERVHKHIIIDVTSNKSTGYTKESLLVGYTQAEQKLPNHIAETVRSFTILCRRTDPHTGQTTNHNHKSCEDILVEQPLHMERISKFIESAPLLERLEILCPQVRLRFENKNKCVKHLKITGYNNINSIGMRLMLFNTFWDSPDTSRIITEDANSATVSEFWNTLESLSFRSDDEINLPNFSKALPLSSLKTIILMNKISGINGDVFRFRNLKTLVVVSTEKLEFKNITKTNFPTLETLNIRGNYSKALEEPFDLPALKHIEVKLVGDFKKLQGFEKLESLVEARFANNYIQDITADVKSWKKLAVLDLSFNNLLTIKNLQNAAPLKELRLKGNKINKITGLENFRNLRILDLSNNKIKYLENLDGLKQLRELSVAANPLVKIEQDFTGFDNLTSLDLANTRVKDLDALKPLKTLKELSIEHTPVTNISIIEEFPELDELSVFGCDIQRLKVGNLTINLKETVI